MAAERQVHYPAPSLGTDVRWKREKHATWLELRRTEKNVRRSAAVELGHGTLEAHGSRNLSLFLSCVAAARSLSLCSSAMMKHQARNNLGKNKFISLRVPYCRSLPKAVREGAGGRS